LDQQQWEAEIIPQEKRQKGMLNFGKYAAIAAAGLGLAALAAPSAEASCAVVCGQVSSMGWGNSYGMATAYRPVTTLRPVVAYRPVTTYHAVGLAYRPSFGAAYGYAAPVRHFYRPIARVIRPATYAWVAPRIHHVFHHVFHPVAAYGAAYGYAPRLHRINYAYGCGC
jgi:hypothetical protein